MNNFVYSRLTVSNIRKNAKIYVPYLISIICSVLFFYILSSLGNNPNIYDRATKTEAFQGAEIVSRVLALGQAATGFFIVIFLFYANGFILKRTQRQLGLYRVLGMERRHLVRLMVYEVLLLYGIGMIGGLTLGILLDKLVTAGLFRIIGQEIYSGFFIGKKSILYTLILFLFCALVSLVRSMISVLKTKDIELLKSGRVGEGEPKNQYLKVICGLVCLLVGYYLAVRPGSAMSGIYRFFPAAILVIFATYELFTAGSIALLKYLRRNKNYYYRTKHFISVSGMLFRMKQNAAGLASICILSTSAILVFAAGAALYANGEKSISEMYPCEVQIRCGEESLSVVTGVVEEIFSKQGMTGEKSKVISYSNSIFNVVNGELDDHVESFAGFESMPDVYFLTLEEYNRILGEQVTLKDDEVLSYVEGNLYPEDVVRIHGLTYRVKGRPNPDCLKYIADHTMSLFSKMLVVVKDETVLEEFVKNAIAYVESPLVSYVGFDLDGCRKKEELITDLRLRLGESGITYKLFYQQEERAVFYSMYGGILFIGGFLSIMFMLSTLMIIYYKQMSEGYEDRERFQIMQKVGLTRQEIQGSIHSQVLTMFFLPLVTAILHAGVALPLVARCLRMVILVHMPTFLISYLVTCVLFSVLYCVAYRLTSTQYYKIVKD